MVTTFVAQTSQSLRVDYGQVTASLLFELIDVQRAAANGSLVNNVPHSGLTPFSEFHPTTSDSLVNGLWFTSLSFSLITALFAVLTKQWIHQYMSESSGTPQDRCRVHQFRYMGLEKWGVGVIIGLLPVLMSISLCIFLVGLVVFLVPLQVSIAFVIGAITSMSFAAYFITNLLPIIYSSCPYKTPLSQYIFSLYSHIAHSSIFTSVISPIFRYWSGSSSVSEKVPIHTLREAEHEAVQKIGDKIDAHALSWLFSTSSNRSVQMIAAESTSSLPLQCVALVQHYAKGLPAFCLDACESLRSDSKRSDSLLDTNKVDRYIRAHLRLDRFVYVINMVSLFRDQQQQMAPDVCAELLAVENLSDTKERIKDLIVTNLRTPQDSQSLHLEPIVWRRLLSRIMHYRHWDVYELLFHALPTKYWYAHYKPPPLSQQFHQQLGLSILMKPMGDHLSRDTLSTAISESLFMSIGDILLEGCDNFHVKDSVYDNPTVSLPQPNEPRLQFLLHMARSPSIHKIGAVEPSLGTFFNAVLRGIIAYTGVERDEGGYQFLDKAPILPKNSHSTIIDLLKILVLSDKYGVSSDSMFAEDRHTTLITFFRVLRNISPLSLKDSISAELAVKFVSIAFQDGLLPHRRVRPHSKVRHATETAELIVYLFENSNTMNVAFAHFVEKRFFDSFVEDFSNKDHLRNWRMIIRAFVARLSELPIKLDDEILQKSLNYLYEPQLLQRACVILINDDDFLCYTGNMPDKLPSPHTTLYQLALLRFNDSVWSPCLQSLQENPMLTERHHSCRILDLKYHIEQGYVELKKKMHRSCMTSNVRPVQRDDEQTKSAWSKVKLLLLLLRWARQHCTREAQIPEEVEMSSYSNQV